MAVDLEQEILALLGAPEARARGHVTMGEVVDQLVVRGHGAEEIESTIWSMLQSRRLTPNGYVCRTLRRRVEDGIIHRRSYEFTLVPWDPDLDRQLSLLPDANVSADDDDGGS